MRKHLLLLLAAFPIAAGAQTVADFETPVLPKPDTFFMRFDMPKQDIGINSGLAHFPLFADTAFGFKFWSGGITYSSMRDSISGGQGNQYSARPGGGAHGSAQYGVSYGEINKVILLPPARGRSVAGFYATNGTYAYNSIKSGDAFSRKFGDTTGTHSGLPQGSYPDYFKLVVRGYSAGVLQPDTVEFYLADYRNPDSAKDYIVKDWRWVSLTKLGGVDSLQFRLYSSDTGAFGINTPLYFCLDDFTTNDGVGVHTTPSPIIAKVFPNPAQDVLHIALTAGSDVERLALFDMSGKLLFSKEILGQETQIDMRSMPAGNYILQLQGAQGQVATQHICKQ
jgi:hypothetical protein